MEPQKPKNARIANEFRPRPVKGIGGNGQARVALVDGQIVGIELNNAEKTQVALYPGAALKLVEQLVHAARKALMNLADEAQAKVDELVVSKTEAK